MKSKFYASFMLCAIGALSATAQTQLWGTSYSGGATGQGTIFSADGNGTNFHTEYSLVNALGAMPNGTPVLANNHKLYGVTELGGYGDSCVVYSYDPSNGTFTNIHDLFQYTQYGWEAKSGMLKAEDGTLYGLCAAGGANGELGSGTAPANGKKHSVGQVMRLENLIFEVGKSKIDPGSYPELDIVVNMMKENKDMVIQLEGHTDYQGDAKENLKLSQYRVDAVRNYIVSKSINKLRIKTKAFGGAQPLSKDNTPEAHRLNRRVEVRVLEN